MESSVDGLTLAVVGATILSGFFALANYSLREFRRGRLEELWGPKAPERSALLERQFTAIRLNTAFGRSLANMVLVVALLYRLDASASNLGRVAAAMAAAWALIAVFGEAVPHAWASASAERVLATLLGPMLLLRYILYPVVAALQALDIPIRRLSGVQSQPQDHEEAKQEIISAATEGRAEGAVDAEEVKMIESVIEFGDRQAGEIMTPRTDIVALPAATKWQEACAKVYQAGHTRIPIYEGDLDNIVGVLYAKDLLAHVGGGNDIDLRTLMRKPYFVPETKRLNDLLREFKSRKIHVAIVLDEYGGTAGLVSFEDVLEEIVGEISDEYDRPEPALMKRIDETTVEVDGRMYIDDLNEALHLGLPQDAGYDTVAGFIFSEIGYIPSVGESLTAHDARFTVLAADERKITRIKIQLLPKEEA